MIKSDLCSIAPYISFAFHKENLFMSNNNNGIQTVCVCLSDAFCEYIYTLYIFENDIYITSGTISSDNTASNNIDWGKVLSANNIGVVLVDRRYTEFSKILILGQSR